MNINKNNKNKNIIKKIKYFSFFKENEILIHSSNHIIETFKLFFFKDLLTKTKRENNNNHSSISLISFIDYFEMPRIISERLSKILFGEKKHLKFEEFSHNLKTFFDFSFENVIYLIFKIYDFDDDDFINLTDIKIIWNNIFKFNQIKNNNNLFICPFVKNIEKDYCKIFNFDEFCFLIKEKNSDLFLIVFFYFKKIYDEIEKIIKKFFIHKNNNKILNNLNDEISCGKFIFFENKLKINYNLINKEKIKNIFKKNSNNNLSFSFNNNNNNNKIHSRNFYSNFNNFSDRNEKNNESIILTRKNNNNNNNNKIFYTIDEKNSSLYQTHMKIIKSNIEKTNKEINKKINDLRQSNEYLENQKDNNNFYNFNKIPINKFRINITNNKKLIIPKLKINSFRFSEENNNNNINEKKEIKYLNTDSERKPLKLSKNIIQRTLMQNSINSNRTERKEILTEKIFFNPGDNNLVDYYFELNYNFFTFYHNNDKTEMAFYIYLINCTINPEKNITINDKTYYVFSLGHNLSKFQFYFDDKILFNKILTFLMNKFSIYNNSNIKEKYPIFQENILYKGKITTLYKTKNEQYLIKYFHKNQLKLIDYVALKHEISIMLYINDYENVSKLIEFGEDFNNIYIVMEYYDMKEISCFIEYKFISRVKDNLLKNIFNILLDTLINLHNNGIIHRDIKPQNILFNNLDKSIKLIDFGLSRFLSKNQIISGEPFGTLGYAAPELLNGEKYGFKVDIFSLGVVMYYLKYGIKLFQGHDKKSTADKTKTGKYTKLVHKTNDDYQDNKDYLFDNLIDCMININPKNRISLEDAKKHKWFYM